MQQWEADQKEPFTGRPCKSRHEVDSAGALDLTGDFTMKVGCQTSQTTGKDLAALRGELLEKVGILEINRIRGDVEATARHAAVGSAEVGAALWCFW